MQISEPSDADLLADWLIRQREPAFHALVARYAGLVHMAAKRTCSDDSLAAEASQLTFILLARKAKSLASRNSLAGWLHLTAVMQAKNLTRQNRREHHRRQLLQTAMEADSSNPSGETWQEMQPVLDDALAALSANDREALLLRFYRSLTIREIGETLGIATDAAQKRIDRATERLRGKLLRRGVQTGGSLAATLFAGVAGDAQAAGIPVSVLTSKALAAISISSGTFTAIATLITNTALKTTSCIPPLVGLGLAVAWIGVERRAIFNVERELGLMRDHLTGNVGSVTSPRIRGQLMENVLALDWKELVTRFDDPFIRRQFQKRMEQMQASELTRSLREIAALDFLQSDRLVLEGMIMRHLIQIDPEYALISFKEQIGDSGPLGRLLPKALAQWTVTDPARSTAWFDEQIAAGRFKSRMLNGNNAVRISFEAHAIAALLGSGPTAAGIRLQALSDNDKVEVMCYAGGLDVLASPRAFAELVRLQLPESAHLAAISSQAATMVLGNDYTRVAGYLDTIEATPPERAATVRGVIWKGVRNVVTERKFNHADLESIRKWTATQSPGLMGEVTGDALGIVSIQQSGQMDFSQIVGLVSQCHESGDGDALLIHFLENTDTRSEINRTLCRGLAEKITDENRRAEFLETLK